MELLFTSCFVLSPHHIPCIDTNFLWKTGPAFIPYCPQMDAWFSQWCAIPESLTPVSSVPAVGTGLWPPLSGSNCGPKGVLRLAALCASRPTVLLCPLTARTVTGGGAGTQGRSVARAASAGQGVSDVGLGRRGNIFWLETFHSKSAPQKILEMRMWPPFIGSGGTPWLRGHEQILL